MDHPTRHRHHSGMSDEDDDLHKELNYSVEINDGNFSWDLDKQDLCLKNINIAVPSGEWIEYSKTCLKQPLKKKVKIGFQDQLSLNACQKYCRMLSWSILLYFWPALSDIRS